ncbi:MAG: hypothetical protein G5703_12125, partial [Serratia symbiotica]|nr:hypothetical protein [Serratia symbiotica]
AMLPCCHVAMLPCCHVAMLPCCHVALGSASPPHLRASCCALSMSKLAATLYAYWDRLLKLAATLYAYWDRLLKIALPTPC